ncbi:MAG: hypothetical protein GDA44_09775, partial [Prochloron sp. SP5CPC1]|nr:hypothetical protein [Candidatus Paraprochloron terpiosi SP5CPC1]
VQWGLGDNLGTIRLVVNSAGEVVNRIVYDSFGVVIEESNPGVDFRYGFTGRELDPITGLVYYRARYYDGERFISEDPIGFGGGDGNLYRYVGNSPTNFTDPLGNNAAAVNPGLIPGLGRILTDIGSALGGIGGGIVKGLGGIGPFLYFPGGGGLLNPRPLADGTLPPGRDPNGLTKPNNPPPLHTPPFPDFTSSPQDRPGDFGPVPGDVPNTAPFPFPVPDEGVGPNIESFPKNSCPAIPPFLESDQSSGAENLPNLTGKTRNEARQELRNKGFDYRGVTPGGYEKWYHPDGSRVQIRPNGEVTRQGPKIIPTDGGKKYRPAIGPNGERLTTPQEIHNTGENLLP